MSRESGALAALVAALNDLKVKAGLVDNGRIIRHGRQQSPPIDFKPQTLSDWFTGRAVPSDSRAFRVMLDYLQRQAHTKSGRAPTDWQWWEQLRLKARDERRTRKPRTSWRGPLRVLVVTADPANTTQDELDEELRSISVRPTGIKFRSAWAATAAELAKAVDKYEPTILHFASHDWPPHRTRPHSLCSEFLTSEPVLRLLREAAGKNLRAVLLNQCYSYTVAHKLSATGPCVFGWRLALNEATASFFTSFYRSLTFGATLKEAAQQGCAAILLAGLEGAEDVRLISHDGSDTRRPMENTADRPATVPRWNGIPLLNEVQCAQYVREALNGTAQAAVTYIDIDGLLAINTIYGARVGDLVLAECGDIVRRHYQDSGLVCRLRGDQFVLAGTTDVAEKHTREVLRRIRTNDWSTISPNLFVTATASTAYRQPDEDAASLLLRAILGVKQAKRTGKDSFGPAPLALPRLDGGPNAQWHARIAEIPTHLSDDDEYSYTHRLRAAGFTKVPSPTGKPDRVIEPEQCEWCRTGLRGTLVRPDRIQVVDQHDPAAGLIEYVSGRCPECHRLNPPAEP